MSQRKRLRDQQSLLADNFMYFFLRMRKHRIRTFVDRLRRLHPGETREQLAERLIEAQTPLSFLAGTLFHAPVIVPGLGFATEVFGLVGGSAALMRMHLYLILEIAHLYGRDIDDPARVPEITAVVSATAVTSIAPPMLLRAAKIHPLLGLPLSGMSAAGLARLIGNMAVQHYGEPVPKAAALAEAPSGG